MGNENEIKTPEDFGGFVKQVEERVGYRRPVAFGIGIAYTSEKGDILDTFFPFPNLMSNFGTAAVFADAVGHLSGTATYRLTRSDLSKILDRFRPFINDGKRHGNIDAVKAIHDTYMHAFNRKHFNYRDEYIATSPDTVVVSFIDGQEHDVGPQTVSDAYLRLHLLSHRLVKPNEIKLGGIFGILPNNIWTNEGPISPEDFPKRRFEAIRRRYPIHVFAVDKFPQMADYVIPSGVRIADASRVRLGAYLGEGTTVMHEGFCNFNAGTSGKSMVEGRISAGVMVGDQSDIGGGASIMGTLSGGGKEKITIGRGCLIGANAGTGISLGDLCVIEAGLYVTAGMPVKHLGERLKDRKARDFSGQPGLTFRRNGITGLVEVLDKPNNVVLNEELHKN